MDRELGVRVAIFQIESGWAQVTNVDYKGLLRGDWNWVPDTQCGQLR